MLECFHERTGVASRESTTESLKESLGIFTVHPMFEPRPFSRDISPVPLFGSVRSSVSVLTYVTVPPRIAPFEMADKAVNWGDSVSAVCTIVNGDSPLEITWALNGMPVEENHRISVTTTKRNSLLSIDSASPSHAGTYTCVASNAAGATTYSAELTVNGTYDIVVRTECRFC